MSQNTHVCFDFIIKVSCFVRKASIYKNKLVESVYFITITAVNPKISSLHSLLRLNKCYVPTFL